MPFQLLLLLFDGLVPVLVRLLNVLVEFLFEALGLLLSPALLPLAGSLEALLVLLSSRNVLLPVLFGFGQLCFDLVEGD